VRVKLVLFAGFVFCIGAILAPRVSAQNPDTLMPEQSTAKAKQILQQFIEALGGPSYLEVRESECRGRRALFGHNGELTGYIDFINDRRYPDKDRTEYIAKSHNLKSVLETAIGVDGLDLSHGGVVMVLYNGDHGWTLDRGGVSELPAAAVSDFQEAMKKDINNLLLLRMKENGMNSRFGGSDIVDLKEVDWVEITDATGRTYRLAIDRISHLLVRSVVISDDAETRDRHEDLTIYSNYQLRDGVMTSLQLTRERDGRRASQVFYDTCKYNSGLPDELFTEASLQKRSSQIAVKKDKNKEKD
jgi:hypothetical protein